jgi:glycerate kinase
MKIVIAPNAFKGSMTAAVAAQAMARGIREIEPRADLKILPVSDGGDGLVEVLIAALQGEIRCARVRGPLGKPVEARFGWIEENKLAVLEMAEASGLALLTVGEKNPMEATTAGMGEIMLEALKLAPENMLIGIGGSATCDGGCGMASTLGVRFFDQAGEAFEPKGGTLKSIAGIDRSGLTSLLAGVGLEVACDVENPLLGEEGAARVFAPQKGATAEQVEVLEAGMCHLADLVEKDLGFQIRSLPGTGAAGGLGAGLLAFAGAVLRRGADVVLDRLGFDEALEGAELVMTGEGALDAQTLSGKAPAVVAERASRRGVPCIAVAGRLDGERSVLQEAGFTSLHPLSIQPMSLQSMMQQAEELLARASAQAVKEFMHQ